MPVLMERIVYPQVAQEVAVCEREQYEVALQRLCHLWRKSGAILGLTMVHKGFALWKKFIMSSVMADKRAFTRTGSVISVHEYEGDVSKEALKEKFSAWSDHEDECARVDYRSRIRGSIGVWSGGDLPSKLAAGPWVSSNSADADLRGQCGVHLDVRKPCAPRLQPSHRHAQMVSQRHGARSCDKACKMCRNTECGLRFY